MQSFASQRRCSTFCDSIKYRLDIRRRAGNHAKDFARGSLLFQRFFEFLEQPHVLDGDDSLVGEGFKQFDLRRRKGTYFGSTGDQAADEFPLAGEGEQPKRCESIGLIEAQVWKVSLGLDIRNVQRAVLDYPAKMWCINTNTQRGCVGDGTKMGPWNKSRTTSRSRRGQDIQSRKLARRSRRWRQAPAARRWAIG